MALGITIRRWHVLFPVLVGLTYGTYSYLSNSHKENQASEIIKVCFGQSPNKLPEILSKFNPEEVSKVFSSRYGKECDCVPYSEIIAKCLNKHYSPRILHLESPNFIKKYPFECHNTCIFDQYGFTGSIDNICGYIEPQESLEDVIKILEKKLEVKQLVPSIQKCPDTSAESLLEMLNDSYEIYSKEDDTI